MDNIKIELEQIEIDLENSIEMLEGSLELIYATMAKNEKFKKICSKTDGEFGSPLHLKLSESIDTITEILNDIMRSKK